MDEPEINTIKRAETPILTNLGVARWADGKQNVQSDGWYLCRSDGHIFTAWGDAEIYACEPSIWLPLPDPTTGFAEGVGVDVEGAARAMHEHHYGPGSWDELDDSEREQYRIDARNAFPHAKPISEIKREVMERLAEKAHRQNITACANLDEYGDFTESAPLSDWLTENGGAAE